MRRNLLIAAGAGLALAAPAPALAARAEVVRTEMGDARSRYVFSTVHFDAAPGERNAVTVRRVTGGAELRDEGAPIEPGPRCTAIDEHAVRCAFHDEATVNGVVEGIELSLGDGDDTLGGPAVTASADGGDGNDVLQGATQLSGGAGDDLLRGADRGEAMNGGPGRDRLLGGGGNDSLNGGDPDDAPAPDLLDGGAGTDLVSYQGRAAPVTVDLADPAAVAGAPGEGDAITGLEYIRGGAGHDVLKGDDGPNDIEGGDVSNPVGDDIDGRGGADDLQGTKGDDLIEGGDGDDEIWGVSGADRLSGGAGDDSIDVMLDRRGADRIDCGAGDDYVSEPSAAHVLAADCETAWLLTSKVSPVRGGRPGGQSFRIGAFPNEFPPDCGLIRLGSPAGSLGSLLFKTPRRGTKYVRVPLTARGRRKVRPGARVLVRFTAYYDCRGRRPSEATAPSAFTFVL